VQQYVQQFVWCASALSLKFVLACHSDCIDNVA